MSKGSKPRPIANRKSFDDNFEAIFGKKENNPDVDHTGHVRYKAHPETGEMVPDYMWQQLGMWEEKPKTHFVVRDYKEYESPITGKVVSGRRQHRYDLQSNNCRVYEGRDSEQRAADSHLAQEDKKLDEVLDKSISRTMNDINYQNNKPPELDKNGKPKVSWTFGL